MTHFEPQNLFNLEQLEFKDIFNDLEFSWEVLPKIKEYILEVGKNLSKDFDQISEFVWIGKETTIEKTATIKGPAIIGHETEIRHCAYIRENVLIGNNVTVGNSTEVKNSILFNNVEVPHFNYVGDSVMGYKSHIGAGVILSNVKSTKDNVKVLTQEGYFIQTNLRKFGSLIGDFVEVGCNSVLNPGTIIGRNSIIYPLTSVRGCVPEKHILKSNGILVAKRS